MLLGEFGGTETRQTEGRASTTRDHKRDVDFSVEKSG